MGEPNKSHQPFASNTRISTGIPGLDSILDGGLLPGSVYIVQGTPGAGKTILANQLCFHRAAQGEQVLYVTLLAESHDRLMQHLQGMSFYDGAKVPSSVYYVSGYDDLENGGLTGILRLLNGESRARKASTIIVDGLFVLEESLQSEKDFRRFINNLANLASMLNCTILLLTNSRRGPTSPEFTMVDGWIEIGMSSNDYRSYRYLEVHKFRGSGFIPGQHMTGISGEGLRVLPRLETTTGLLAPEQTGEQRVSIGQPQLDRLLGGGVPAGSTTLVLGPTGIGKTTLGLHFLAECANDGPGLLFGFYESPRRLERKARLLGLDLQSLVARGRVEIIWVPPTEKLLDDLGYRLLDAIRRRGARRVFVDGIDAIGKSTFHANRLAPFLAALTNAMRDDGVTSVFTSEIPQLVGGDQAISIGPISAVAENIVLLRYVEIGSTLRRILSLLKVRESDFDTAIREFTVTPQGLRIGQIFNRMEGLLTGHAHQQAPTGT